MSKLCPKNFINLKCSSGPPSWIQGTNEKAHNKWRQLSVAAQAPIIISTSPSVFLFFYSFKLVHTKISLSPAHYLRFCRLPFVYCLIHSSSESMDWSGKIFLTGFLLVFAAASIDGVYGDTMVTGTVFCDQCRDGQISLYDYPLSGMNVTLACPGSGGQYTTWREEITNWVGSYAMKFDGTPDLRGCYAQVASGGQGSSDCGVAAGPAGGLRLMFNMFDMEMYTVDPLLAQPAEPMSFCPKSPTPTVPVAPVKPPPVRLPPAPHQPPLPRFPPMPFFEASACSHQQWMMPEHRCYWKVVSPDTKVAIVFGPFAAHKYGTDLTLWQGMSGRGEPVQNPPKGRNNRTFELIQQYSLPISHICCNPTHELGANGIDSTSSPYCFALHEGQFRNQLQCYL